VVGSHDKLQAHATGAGDPHGDPALVTVRRLTPRECERLQGFPDDWTALNAVGQPVCDAARYRAIGNAVAVPVIAWIGHRLLTTDHPTASTSSRQRHRSPRLTPTADAVEVPRA